jgi:hypothetical protein
VTSAALILFPAFTAMASGPGTELKMFAAALAIGILLVPLSCHWDDSTLTIATPRASRTARNLVRAGWARVALGPTRDVVIIEGPVEAIPIG